MTATSVLVTQRPGRPGRAGRTAKARLPWANPAVYFVALIAIA
ncbi:hypothetical protein M2389_002875 [Microbacterium phyllosphaerae]|nr:hypothetical protein [Microbacterium phyllosphaerae]